MSKKKKQKIWTKEERIKWYAEQGNKTTQAMIDDYNNPQSNTREIIEALKDM